VMHRLTDVGNSIGGSANPCKRLRYDNTNGILGTRPSGVTISNTLARLAEAVTDTCVWPITQSTIVSDEWLSYSNRGELTDEYESTPHSGSYYHATASYWANGAANTLVGVPGQSGWTFGVDSEGRWSTATQGSNTLVSATSFNAASQPLSATLGLGDSDTYGYDPNNGRMTSYTFTVGSTPKSMSGVLAWNANGSLSKLAITDGFNSGGTQTCKYGDPTSGVPGYDDLGRLIKVDCGASIWQQNFSYDPFGNVSKTVPTGGTGIAWNPGYNQANNHYTLGGTSYDSNGNLLTDTFHTYTWNVYGRVSTLDSSACGTNGTCLTYDAFDRMVEKNVAGTYSEVLYSPLGKTAVMNGSTIVNVYVPLPGGSTFHMVPGGQTFWHPDWLGTIRLESSRANRAVTYDRAFAPFGETYKNFGTTVGYDFTGGTQDTISGMYDTANRELHPTQGRWLSPDPAGLQAVEPMSPQTWNRYAYVGNNPLALTDPSGLDSIVSSGFPSCADQKIRALCAAGDSTHYLNSLFPTWSPFVQIPVRAWGCWGDCGWYQVGIAYSTGLLYNSRIFDFGTGYIPISAKKNKGACKNVGKRVAAGFTGAGSLFFGGAKILGAAALGTFTPETLGLSDIPAAYLVINGTGQAVAGSASLGYAFSGDENIESGGHAVTAVTTVSGLGTLLATGSPDKAAQVGAWENIVPATAEFVAGEQTLKVGTSFFAEDTSALVENMDLSCTE
jgi:RHS repeat-associated protein